MPIGPVRVPRGSILFGKDEPGVPLLDFHYSGISPVAGSLSVLQVRYTTSDNLPSFGYATGYAHHRSKAPAAHLGVL